MAKQDTYGEPRLIVFDNMVARVYSPILTEAERKQRLEAIEREAAKLLMLKEKQEVK